MLRKVHIFLYFGILFFSKQLQAQNRELSKLFEEIKYIDYQMNPNLSLDNSLHPYRIYFLELDEYGDLLWKYKKALQQLLSLSENKMTNQELISKNIMFLKLRDQISLLEFKTYLIPFNAEGGFYNSLAYYLPKLPFNTLNDYTDYLRWLPSFSQYLENSITLMKQGMKLGVVPPKVVTAKNIDLMKGWVNIDLEKSPFLLPFQNFPEEINEETKDSLITLTRNIVLNQILPAYKNLKDFTENKYLPASSDKIGAYALPNGRAYYENRVRHYTTLNITPDSVYDLGLQEVDRIKIKMQAAIDSSGFEGRWNQFLTFLITDPQFFAKTPQELLNYASWLSKKSEGLLPQYFSKLYSLPFTVEAVPDEIAKAYTSGRYVHGDAVNGVPGTYWVNTYNLSSRTLYTLPALTLHEAVPGHHLQTTLAAEIPNLPEFRNLYYISAFGEGWALYCEYLGEEMGMYTTPYELFGRYTYEMWRACRLVVDVGIHHKRWSRKKAIAYLRKNTALSLHEIETEIDRYIGWPGQALSYKVGEIAIKSHRAKAEKELGENFDLKEFHYQVLKNGSIPLSVLNQEMIKYINHNLNTTHERKESP